MVTTWMVRNTRNTIERYRCRPSVTNSGHFGERPRRLTTMPRLTDAVRRSRVTKPDAGAKYHSGLVGAPSASFNSAGRCLRKADPGDGAVQCNEAALKAIAAKPRRRLCAQQPRRRCRGVGDQAMARHHRDHSPAALPGGAGAGIDDVMPLAVAHGPATSESAARGDGN